MCQALFCCLSAQSKQNRYTPFLPSRTLESEFSPHHSNAFGLNYSNTPGSWLNSHATIHVYPEAQHVMLFGGRVFANAIQLKILRFSWLRVGLKSNDK